MLHQGLCNLSFTKQFKFTTQAASTIAHINLNFDSLLQAELTARLHDLNRCAPTLTPTITVTPSDFNYDPATTATSIGVPVAVRWQPFRPPAKKLAIESPDGWKAIGTSPSIPSLVLSSASGLSNTSTTKTASATSTTDITTPAPKPPRFRLLKKALTPSLPASNEPDDNTTAVYGTAANTVDVSVTAPLTYGSLRSEKDTSSIIQQNRPSPRQFDLSSAIPPPHTTAQPPLQTLPPAPPLTDEEQHDDGQVPLRWTSEEDAELRQLREDNVRYISLTAWAYYAIASWFLFIKIFARSLSTLGLRGKIWWQCSTTIKTQTSSELNFQSRTDGENYRKRSNTILWFLILSPSLVTGDL